MALAFMRYIKICLHFMWLCLNVGIIVHTHSTDLDYHYVHCSYTFYWSCGPCQDKAGGTLIFYKHCFKKKHDLKEIKNILEWKKKCEKEKGNWRICVSVFQCRLLPMSNFLWHQASGINQIMQVFWAVWTCRYGTRLWLNIQKVWQ